MLSPSFLSQVKLVTTLRVPRELIADRSSFFAGNQAAVIVLDDSADHDNIAQDEPLCQRIAQEFHLSETAFAKPLPGGTESQPKYLLRWWTPTYEIPLW